MGALSRPLRWLRYLTSVCAADIPTISNPPGLESHAKDAASVFLSNLVDRDTKP